MTTEEILWNHAFERECEEIEDIEVTDIDEAKENMELFEQFTHYFRPTTKIS